MSVYGSRLYGDFRYGVGSTTDISVYPFTTQSLDYGTIKLSWVYPTNSDTFPASGAAFLLIRSASGFPITPDGGDVIYAKTKTELSSVLGATATLTDTGSFYDPITGSATATYAATTAYATNGSTSVILTAANASIKVGQAVTYAASGYLTGPNAASGITGGTTVATINGTNLTLSSAASIPAGTSLTFTPILLTPGKSYYYSAFVLTNGYWIRVGTALGISIKNYNTADVMYNSLPEIYRTSSTGVNRNDDLYNFLRIIGIQYDFIKTKVENAKGRYDITNVNGKLLPALMDQMGFSYESGLGIHQARRILSNADYIYLNKGTGQGIEQFVTSFTGYSATINSFKNLFLTLDCSSFETSKGFWNTSGNALSIATTTAAEEGGSPAPYSETYSPTGYPNSQLGYLRATVTSVAASSVWEISYGHSLDSVIISGTGSNSSASGYSYITINTDTEHNFSVGDSVVLQGMSPNYMNGIWKIITIPNAKAFTFYNASATTSLSIYGDGISPIKLYNPRLYGIPVVAGTNYYASIYVYTPAVRNIRTGVRWYDERGTELISSTYGDITGDTPGFWKRVGVAATAPTGAAYAAPYIQILSPSNGEVYYFDASQFEANTIVGTTYADPRRIDIYLSAPRVNEIINPGFGLGTTNWSTTGTSAFTTDASNIYPTSSVGLGTAISTNSAKLIANASSTTLTPNSTIPVTAGKPYSLSAYIKAAATNLATITVVWKNSGGTTLQTDTSPAATLSTSFTRVSLTPVTGSSTQMYAPATAATATITFTITGASGNVYYVDSILFEQSAYVNAYFDGGTGYNVTEDLIWEQNAAGTKGTASTGRGLYYPNRLITQSRLNDVIEDYLPIGSSYAIFIGTTAT
jgi:phage tail-like protein